MGGGPSCETVMVAAPSYPSGCRPSCLSQRRLSQRQSSAQIKRLLAPLHRDFISPCSSSRVDRNDGDRDEARRRAVEVRARAADRGRRLLLVTIGLSAALSGAFAALAAGSTHTKKAAPPVPATRATAVSLPAPHATAPSATPPGGVQAAPVAPAEPPASAVA